jgi:hypothetical protein
VKVRELHRWLRRFHRALRMVLLTMYCLLGIMMIIGMDSPQTQGWLHIALGIAHGLA